MPDAMEESPLYLDHARRPRNRGRLEPFEGRGRAGGGECADTIEVTIRVSEDVIAEIAFETSGCEAAVACGSVLTELARGKHLDEASEIEADTIVAALGGLAAEKRHVAQIAAEAFANAAWDYIIRMIEKGSPGDSGE